MVKRKVDKSLEEWLRESGAIPAHNQVGTLAPKEEQNLPLSPTVEAAQSEVTAEAVVATLADVAAIEAEVSKWFWDLLEQSGYERW